MNKIFYHIHIINELDDKWKIGNIIEFGVDNNFFYEQSINFSPKVRYNDLNCPIGNLYDYFIDNKMINEILKLPNLYNTFISEYGTLVREIGLEMIRNAEFSEFPSRKKCIWLCREDQIEYWKKRINNNNIKIFKVQVEENVFKFNEKYLPLPSDSYKEILNKSRKYWSYKSESDELEDEYLYIGKIKILDEI